MHHDLMFFMEFTIAVVDYFTVIFCLSFLYDCLLLLPTKNIT